MKWIITPNSGPGTDDDGPGIRAYPDLGPGRYVLDDETMTTECAGRVEFRGLDDMAVDAVVEVDLDAELRLFVSSLTFLPRPGRPLSGLAVRSGTSVPELLRIALEVLTFAAAKTTDTGEWVTYVHEPDYPPGAMPKQPRRTYHKITDDALAAFVEDFLDGGYPRAQERHHLSYPTARKWKQYAVDRKLLPRPATAAGGRPTHRRGAGG